MLLASITVKSSSRHGKGLFATAAIARGTVVWHPCTSCRIWSNNDLLLLTETQLWELDEYGYRLDNGGIILPCHNAHLMNHSCNAAVLDYGLDFGIAVRDIAVGEEVTCDYRTFVSDLSWQVECKCNYRDCIKLITPQQGLDSKLQQQWQAAISEVLPLMGQLVQPLEESLLASSAVYYSLKQSALNYGSSSSLSIRRPSFLKFSIS